jgi:hypothetical protein
LWRDSHTWAAVEFCLFSRCLPRAKCRHPAGRPGARGPPSATTTSLKSWLALLRRAWPGPSLPGDLPVLGWRRWARGLQALGMSNCIVRRSLVRFPNDTMGPTYKFAFAGWRRRWYGPGCQHGVNTVSTWCQHGVNTASTSFMVPTWCQLAAKQLWQPQRGQGCPTRSMTSMPKSTSCTAASHLTKATLEACPNRWETTCVTDDDAHEVAASFTASGCGASRRLLLSLQHHVELPATALLRANVAHYTWSRANLDQMVVTWTVASLMANCSAGPASKPQ